MAEKEPLEKHADRVREQAANAQQAIKLLERQRAQDKADQERLARERRRRLTIMTIGVVLIAIVLGVTYIPASLEQAKEERFYDACAGLEVREIELNIGYPPWRVVDYYEQCPAGEICSQRSGVPYKRIGVWGSMEIVNASRHSITIGACDYWSGDICTGPVVRSLRDSQNDFVGGWFLGHQSYYENDFTCTLGSGDTVKVHIYHDPWYMTEQGQSEISSQATFEFRIFGIGRDSYGVDRACPARTYPVNVASVTWR